METLHNDNDVARTNRFRKLEILNLIFNDVFKLAASERFNLNSVPLKF
jgi:hypothetical protein